MLQAFKVNDMKTHFLCVRFKLDRGRYKKNKNRKVTKPKKRCWYKNRRFVRRSTEKIYMTNLLRYMKEKSNYNTKEEAVEFLMNETNLTYEECSKANDFHIRLK